MQPNSEDQPPSTSKDKTNLIHQIGSKIIPSLEKKSATTVYVFNMSEDVWPFISSIQDPALQKAEIEENANLCDRDLFSLASEDGPILFISPRPISNQFLSYYQDITKNRRIRVLVTQNHSGVICEDILHDQTIMEALATAANSSRRLTLLSYSTSPQFLNLVHQLRHRGLTIFTPESPEEEDAWTVNFFGSKSGIRQLAQKSSAAEPDFRMGDGLVCVGITDAAKIAANKYVAKKSVVIKTNKGHSGAGLLIFRPNDLPSNYHDCESSIYKKLQANPYWERFPIIIEDFVTPATTIAGGFPNVEFKILKTGKIEFLYYCGMRVTKEGIFKGVEIHNSAISDQDSAQMVDTGFFIGESFAAAGYRGYFDVDFIAAKNGHLYVTESNARRTGGTHVYNTALKLFGKDFMYETFILSNNGCALPQAKNFTFAKLLQTLKPILYHPKTKEGLVIISENLLAQHLLAYVIFATTKKRALEIETQMESLLNS